MNKYFQISFETINLDITIMNIRFYSYLENSWAKPEMFNLSLSIT